MTGVQTCALPIFEAVIDFPDEDLPPDVTEKIWPELAALRAEIERHLDDGGRGERVRDLHGGGAQVGVLHHAVDEAELVGLGSVHHASGERDLLGHVHADALAMLDGLASATRVRDERQVIDLYRALCLVALGRSGDADTTIESIVARDPLYRAAGEDLAPRVRASFVDARRRLLPAIIQRQYRDAKAAFDHQEFDNAAKGFATVLDELADPDVAPQAGQPPLLDKIGRAHV